jgi:Domain of unknown function (DUF4148)
VFFFREQEIEGAIVMSFIHSGDSTMLNVHWIAGAAMISLASLAVAEEPGLSRAQVQAELTQARASGELDSRREWAVDGTSAITTRSAAAGARGRAFAEPGLTRAQVRAELDRARASGEMDRYMSQHGGGN